MLTSNTKIKSSSNLKYAFALSGATSSGTTMGGKVAEAMQTVTSKMKDMTSKSEALASDLNLTSNIDPQTTVSFTEVELEDCNHLTETVKIENYYDQKNLTVYNRFVHNWGTNVAAGIYLPELAKLEVEEQSVICYVLQLVAEYIFVKEGLTKKKMEHYGHFSMTLFEPGLVYIKYSNYSPKDVTYVVDALKEVFEKLSDPEKLREILNEKKERISKDIKKDLTMRKRSELNYNSMPDFDGMRYKFPEIHNAGPSVISKRDFWFSYYGGSIDFGTNDIYCPMHCLEKLTDKSDYLDATFEKIIEHMTHKDKYVDLLLNGHCNEDTVGSIIEVTKDILLKDTNQEIGSKVSARTYDRKADSDKPHEIEYEIEEGKEGFRFNRAAVMHHIYLDDLVKEGIDATKVDLIMRFLMEMYYNSIKTRCKATSGDMIKTKVLSYGDSLKQLSAPANFRYLYAEIENEEKSTEAVKQEVLNYMEDLVIDKEKLTVAIANSIKTLGEKDRNELEWPEYMNKDITNIFEYVPKTDGSFGTQDNTQYLAGEGENYEKFKKAVETLTADEVGKVVDVLRRQYTVFYADRNPSLPELDDEERRERENGYRYLRSKKNI